MDTSGYPLPNSRSFVRAKPKSTDLVCYIKKIYKYRWWDTFKWWDKSGQWWDICPTIQAVKICPASLSAFQQVYPICLFENYIYLFQQVTYFSVTLNYISKCTIFTYLNFYINLLQRVYCNCMPVSKGVFHLLILSILLTYFNKCITFTYLSIPFTYSKNYRDLLEHYTCLF